jgi:hypothetical protein
MTASAGQDSSTLVDVLALFRLSRLRVRSLSVDPFPDVCRTVSECDAVAFAECQDFDGLAINQTDVPEIDGDCTAFLPERGPKNVHVFSCNPPTYAQDSSTFFSQESVDSACHCSFASSLFRRLAAASVTSAARTAYRLRRRRRRSSGAAPHETAPDRVVLSPNVRANLAPSQIVENRNENSARGDGALANVADFENFANFAILVFFSGT